MDALDISRWQFGITTVYHFVFVPLTIGLAPLVAVMQTVWVVTGNDTWYRLTKFFGKLFLINFALGVATGIVQEFQFGMNWSEYSRFVGDVFGAPLALEGLVAFFLESTFLGLWIFGWNRLPKVVHLATIWVVAIGVNASAYFIIAANSFMQHPVGARYNPETGRAELTSIWELLTNNTALAAFPHAVAGAFLTAGTFVAGIAGWWMVRAHGDAWTEPEERGTSDEAREGGIGKGGRTARAERGPKGMVRAHGDAWTEPEERGTSDEAREGGIGKGGRTARAERGPKGMVRGLKHSGGDGAVMFRPVARLAMGVIIVSGAALVFTGDVQGKLMFEQQPMKMASAESLCHGQTDPDFSVLTVGTHNNCDSVTHLIEVPGVLSFLAKGQWSGVDLKGVVDLQAEYVEKYGPGDYRPNLFVTYWSFRMMITLAAGSALLALAGLWVTRGGRVPHQRWFGWLSLLAIPTPFLANSAGWVFTEMGRQPWVVAPNPTGVDQIRLTVSQSVSDHSATTVLTSLIVFTAIYAVLAVAWFVLIRRYVLAGPLPHDEHPHEPTEQLSFAY